VLNIGGEITYIETLYDEYLYEYYDLIETEEVATVERVGGFPDGCSSVTPLPKGLSESTTAFFENAIVLCGGFYEANEKQGCYKLSSASGTWESMRSLPIGTASLASSVIDGKWLISGGVDDTSRHDNTMIYENGVFTPGPRMPNHKMRHCQLTINSTHVFFVGGYEEGAFILDWPRQEFTVLEAPPVSPFYPACGVINSSFDQGSFLKPFHTDNLVSYFRNYDCFG